MLRAKVARKLQSFADAGFCPKPCDDTATKPPYDVAKGEYPCRTAA